MIDFVKLKTLLQTNAIIPPIWLHPHLKKSAVLIILAKDHIPYIVLTKRAAHLKDHAGQMSFPGGCVIGAETPEQTALRETKEEIGLHPNNFEIISQLATYITGTGFQIAPLIATLKGAPQFIIDTTEVAEIVKLPLSLLLDAQAFRQEQKEWQGNVFSFYVLEYQHYYIWGATAALLKQIAEVLQKL